MGWWVLLMWAEEGKCMTLGIQTYSCIHDLESRTCMVLGTDRAIVAMQLVCIL